MSPAHTDASFQMQTDVWTDRQKLDRQTFFFFFDRHINKKIYIQTDTKQTDGQTDIYIYILNRQTSRQTDRQILGRLTDRY